MTGEEAAATTGKDRPRAWRWATLVVGLLVGAIFVVSAVTADGFDLRPQRYGDLAGLAEAERADYERLEARLNRLTEQVDELAGQVDDDQVNKVRGQVDRLRDPAGLTPREGPGITVMLEDSPDDAFREAAALSQEERDELGIRLSYFNVHQQDIQAVVNAMWDADATAVTINGQRVVSTTGIKCEGSVVQLQGQPYAQPFVISAVGDPAALTRSVELDSWVQGYRYYADHEDYQLGWDLEAEEHLEAPAYTGLIDHEYATPIS